MKLIYIVGANATGKSTRVTKIVDSLGKSYEPIMFRNKEAGRIYESGFAIIGNRTKSGKWVGMDSFPENNWDERHKFLKSVTSTNGVHTVIMEGYFNMVALAASSDRFLEDGFDEIDYYFFLYDKIEDYLERVNMRKGETRTLEWAENSVGWGENNSRLRRAYERHSDYVKSSPNSNVTCERLDINVCEYYFVDKLNLKRNNEIKAQKPTLF
jgi:hypothetical protein